MGPRAALLLLSLACSCSAQKVKVRAEVTGYVGQDVTLPCTYSPDNSDIKITQVTWMKETGGKKTNVAVYSPNWGKNLPNPRISFLKESLQEPTLVIKSLMMTDEGTYGCEFATYPDGNEEGTTRLILLAEPRNSAAAVPGAVGDAVGDREITVANCTSANGKPPSDITWQSVLPGNVSTRVINNTDGTITVNSQYKIFPTSEANGKTVTCIIASRTASVPQNIPVVLSIQYPPEVRISGYDDNWYINRQQAELTCTASGNPPPSKYEWKTASGQPLPNTVDVVGNLLVVKTVDNLVNTTFLCQATNSLGTSSAQLEVLVRERAMAEQSDSIGAIVGGVIGALLLIALIGIVVFFVLRSRKTKDKATYTPKTRIFGNGATSQEFAYREDSELGKPLQGAPRLAEEIPCTQADEDDEKQNYELLEEDDERFNEVGPMLQLRPHIPHDAYLDDDMESQNDGSMISKTAVYV
ncbi:nectin-1-like isoform X3 [Ambystoma mexicanum]|uniref:nectin-1-like isoform X3 n=1 Tax=Ambystoma mexicanum TaxID=8296 RepID=UPI0037E83527